MEAVRGMEAGGGRQGQRRTKGAEGAGGNQDKGRDPLCADHGIVVSGGLQVEEVCLLYFGVAAAEVDSTNLHTMQCNAMQCG